MIEKQGKKVFFSWQSDLPKETTTNVIRAAIRSALSEFEDKNPEVNIQLEEATSNAPGSPDIPAMIFDRISHTDIFIADITTINCSSKERKTANPNVLIELGFALSELGTERIILLFNEAYGVFPGDISFDIDRKRIGKYKIADKKDKDGKLGLSKLLERGITLIIEHNPKKPAEKKYLSPEKKKRDRDIENLKWIMGKLSISILERHIEISPDQIDTRISFFYDEFTAILQSKQFHLYDDEALNLLKELETHWTGTLLSDTYRDTASDNIQKFGNKGGILLTKKDKRDFKKMAISRDNLDAALRKLLAYLRDQYLELDLKELSKEAFFDFQNYTKS